MTDVTRQEILSRLSRLSELAPDMRFGQLIADLAFMAAGPWDQALEYRGRPFGLAVSAKRASRLRRVCPAWSLCAAGACTPSTAAFAGKSFRIDYVE